MEDAGRGRREKHLSAKLKEQAPKVEKTEDEKPVILPQYIANHDPKFFQEQKEIAKTYDHSKFMPDGTKVDFFSLSGTHVESKDRRYYIRAKRDPQTYYFHADDAPPRYARLSDENHPQCVTDKIESCFTKDMLGKTGEFGQYTTRANVFAREGQFFYEAKIISNHGNQSEDPKHALATTQSKDKSRCDRGNVRLGFCRREHQWSEVLGVNAYSYGFVTHGSNTEDYGNVRFQQDMHKVKGINPGNLNVGDVVGLMITLPPLEVHKKVVEGTFDPAEYPHLTCGPATMKPKKQGPSKKGSKAGPKSKESDAPKERENADGRKKLDMRSQMRTNLSALKGINLPAEHEILRDRNPFNIKGVVYFECPDYSRRPDLQLPATRGKTLNPDTGKPWDPATDAHPLHELPHLRTLPGSKIELWVNGKYHGIVWEHLLAFLPPASFIEKSTKTANLSGDVDDGQLGYYPALSHYTGGAALCKFNGPWWFGYDEAKYPGARAFGERYHEGIVEDWIYDVVDEVYQEHLNGDDDWMKKRVFELPATTTVKPE